MIAWVAWDRNGDPRQPQGRPVILRAEQVRATIAMLEHAREMRAAGHRYSLTHDPEWLVDMAINRRAGWPDDPSHSRGSCMPVNGKYPKRAEGDAFMLVWRLSRQLSDRIIVRRQSGACRARCASASSTGRTIATTTRRILVAMKKEVVAIVKAAKASYDAAKAAGIPNPAPYGLIKVRFVRETQTARFKLAAGEYWRPPFSSFAEDDVEIGCSPIPFHRFQIVGLDREFTDEIRKDFELWKSEQH